MPTPLNHVLRVARASRWLLAAIAVLAGATVCGLSTTGAFAATAQFTLASPTFRPSAEMPLVNVYNHDGCKGGNQSPPLVWLHAPSGTASFAVSMADLDAKVGVVWLWLMFNIPSTVTALQQNADADAKLRPPGAMQTRNGFGVLGYQGPCPIRGALQHHYLITVWALDKATTPSKNETSAQEVAVYLRHHALAHASLTPHYNRH
jgi:Raf kinase inhibitor-like YbhB/YbcL family protein